MECNQVMMRANGLVSAVADTALRGKLVAFVEAITGKDVGLTPEEIISSATAKRIDISDMDFRECKSVLYENNLISSGKRNRRIRFLSDKEHQERLAAAATGTPEDRAAPCAAQVPKGGGDAGLADITGDGTGGPRYEAELNPAIHQWLRAQEWFSYLYADAETSVGPRNFNPDLLGVSLPAYTNLHLFEVELVAVETKLAKDQFLEDKLLSEVFTYQTFANYVYAAYYKPWSCMFQPPDGDELDRMLLLQRYGIGVFWVTCQKSMARSLNYRCIMVQGAVKGNTSPDQVSLIVGKYGSRLRNGDDKPLPNLAYEASRYFSDSVYHRSS